MPDKVTPGPICGNPAPREAVCIHTKKVYDSCRDKDCLQDIRVYLTCSSQQVLEGAISVKPVSAELLWASLDVEPISFNRGFYTVDIKYYYRVTADAYSGVGRPRRICGLATFDKRTVLFGSEGSAHIFTSNYVPGAIDIQGLERTNLPIAVVEVVDPVVLGAKIVEGCSCGETLLNDIPEAICSCFEDQIVVSDESRNCTSAWVSSASSSLSVRYSCLCPHTISVCPAKKAPATARTPAICSSASDSRLTSFSRPKSPILSKRSITHVADNTVTIPRRILRGIYYFAPA